MLAKLQTFSLLGIDALSVEVEVDVSPGALPKIVLVGLPEAAVKESTHRVERAIVNSGFVRPQDRVVINLAPAELPKNAASFDLPITLGMLAASGQIASERFSRYAAVGELSLEGTMRPIKGALSMAMAAAKRRDLRGVVLPRENAPEAAVVEEIEAIPVSTLAEAVGFFTGQIDIEPQTSNMSELFERFSCYDDDFADVRGQEMAKRAVTIAAAGSHNLLMLGPPGSGKTMLAKGCPAFFRRCPRRSRLRPRGSTVPPGAGTGAGPARAAALSVAAPHDLGCRPGRRRNASRCPGEISLAHNGVLFLDELPEFNRQRWKSFASRSRTARSRSPGRPSSTTFPGRLHADRRHESLPVRVPRRPAAECNCSGPQIERYMAKISGPLLDRIDIHIEVPAVPYQELSARTPGRRRRDARRRSRAAPERSGRPFRRQPAPVTMPR